MPTHPLQRVFFLASLVSGSIALGTDVTHASHYSFANISDPSFLTRDEQRQLGRAGILDTATLLKWTASAPRRQWLAEHTTLAPERLEALATQCDLLRIEGIGPSVLAVLQKAGIRDSRALARADATELLTHLRVAARGTTMAQKLPQTDTLATWIRSAHRLRPVLDLGDLGD
jgi:predicted flap endonuclease-1-like 5' DNA nuclease